MNVVRLSAAWRSRGKGYLLANRAYSACHNYPRWVQMCTKTFAKNQARAFKSSPGLSDQTLGSEHNPRSLKSGPGLSKQHPRYQSKPWTFKSRPRPSNQSLGFYIRPWAARSVPMLHFIKINCFRFPKSMTFGMRGASPPARNTKSKCVVAQPGEGGKPPGPTT